MADVDVDIDIGIWPWGFGTQSKEVWKEHCEKEAKRAVDRGRAGTALWDRGPGRCRARADVTGLPDCTSHPISAQRTVPDDPECPPSSSQDRERPSDLPSPDSIAQRVNDERTEGRRVHPSPAPVVKDDDREWRSLCRVLLARSDSGERQREQRERGSVDDGRSAREQRHPTLLDKTRE